VTGGPGSAKSTLLDALEKTGFARTIEAGWAVIQVSSGSMDQPCRDATGAVRRAAMTLGD